MDVILVTVGVLAGVISTRIWLNRHRIPNRKRPVMIQDIRVAEEIIPAWFTERMMGDVWQFGLLVSDGRVIVITSITAISSDGRWMDVKLADHDGACDFARKLGVPVYAVHEERTEASVRVDSIVAAVELAYT